MLRVLAAYLAAVLVTYAGAAIAHTQWVLASLADMNVPVAMADRLGATAHDLVGMASLYLPIIAAALAVAFPVAKLIARLLPRLSLLAYPLAGGAALLMVHVILYQTFAITPIASARTTAGLITQALCGVLGGWLFHTLRHPRPEPLTDTRPA